MSRADELRREIESLDGEVADLRKQIKPLLKKVESRVGRIKALKGELWDILQDDFDVLLNEPDAYAQMKDHVARRFGVAHGDLAPVAPSGYFPETRQQAFRISLDSDTDLAPVAAFMREVADSSRPLSPKGKAPRWVFQVRTHDHNASGVVHLVTGDKETYQLVKVTHGHERPLTGAGSLEDLLGSIKERFAADMAPEDDSEDGYAPDWGR